MMRRPLCSSDEIAVGGDDAVRSGRVTPQRISRRLLSALAVAAGRASRPSPARAFMDSRPATGRVGIPPVAWQYGSSMPRMGRNAWPSATASANSSATTKRVLACELPYERPAYRAGRRRTRALDGQTGAFCVERCAGGATDEELGIIDAPGRIANKPLQLLPSRGTEEP